MIDSLQTESSAKDTLKANTYSLNGMCQIGAAVTAIILLGYGMIRLEWQLSELGSFLIGCILLWSPVCILVYSLLANEIPDPEARFTLSLMASYGLTTFLYFVLAEFGLIVIFYLIQVAIWLSFGAYFIRRPLAFRRIISIPKAARFNWFLILIIAASLLVNVRYQIPWAVNPNNGDRTFLLFNDHLYSTALSYELDRHVPPHQATNAGGLPERAYHLFSHLTTALIKQYTGQQDMLRVHIVYHYIVIEVLLCLVLFNIGKALTNTNVTGYLAVLLMYLWAYSWPPLIPNSLGYFYFTIFPHVSSSLDPQALTSPQSYAANVVLYGILLGFIFLSQALSKGRHQPRLLILIALLLATILRFRVQIFLAAMPAFLLLLGLLWLRNHRPIYVLAMLVAITVTGGLYLEMRLPIYAPGSTSLHLGYNGLTQPGSWSGAFYNSWPLSDEIYAILSTLFPLEGLRLVIWQVISITAFTIFNIIGVPLFLATLYALSRRRFARELALYNRFLFFALFFSLLIAVAVTMDYDSYSVPGQMSYQSAGYLFPFAAVVLTSIYERANRHSFFSSSRWIIAVIISVVLVQTAVTVQGSSIAQKAVAVDRTTMTDDEYQVLLRVRERTSRDSVILMRRFIYDYNSLSYAVSGIGGRAAYVEDALASRFITNAFGQDRIAIVNDLWETVDSAAFCRKLLATPITHLITETNDLTKVRLPVACIQLLWRSSDDDVSLWEIKR